MVRVEGDVEGSAALPVVVEGEGQELALQVVPCRLVPGDVAAVEELGAAQQRVGDAEFDELAGEEGHRGRQERVAGTYPTSVLSSCTEDSPASPSSPTTATATADVADAAAADADA